MPFSFPNLFRKTYKVIVSLVLVIAFFFLYNIYLVDHSLINLKAALNDLAQAQTPEDFEKIKPLLKIPILDEISSTGIAPEKVFSLESVNNIVSGDKVKEQVQDARFFLKSVISDKEKERGGLRSFFDRINNFIYKPKTAVSLRESEAQIKSLLSRVSPGMDKAALQQIYYKVANLYFGISQFPEAENYFNKTINVNPGTPLSDKAKFNLSLVYKYSGDYEKALTFLKGLSFPSDEVKLDLSREYEIADVLFKSGKYLESRDKYAELAGKEGADPETSKYLLRASNISFYQLKDYKSALEFLHKFALLNAGKISFYELNELEDAMKYLSRLDENLSGLNADRDKEMREVIKNTSGMMSKDLRQQGYRYLEEKRYLEAIDSFSEAIRVNVYDSRSTVGKGLASYWMNMKEQAQEEALRAVDMSSNDELTLVNALFILINSNNLDEAIRIGEDFIQKRDKAITSPEFYYNLGYAYVLKGQMPQVKLYFDRAIRLNREFAFAYNNLGCALWSLRDYTAAIKKFQEAIDRHPAYADAYFNLGIAYIQLNRLEDAYGQFERVLDIDPGYREAFNYLKVIRDTLGFQP